MHHRPEPLACRKMTENLSGEGVQARQGTRCVPDHAWQRPFPSLAALLLGSRSTHWNDTCPSFSTLWLSASSPCATASWFRRCASTRPSMGLERLAPGSPGQSGCGRRRARHDRGNGGLRRRTHLPRRHRPVERCATNRMGAHRRLHPRIAAPPPESSSRTPGARAVPRCRGAAARHFVRTRAHGLQSRRAQSHSRRTIRLPVALDDAGLRKSRRGLRGIGAACARRRFRRDRNPRRAWLSAA